LKKRWRIADRSGSASAISSRLTLRAVGRATSPGTSFFLIERPAILIVPEGGAITPWTQARRRAQQAELPAQPPRPFVTRLFVARDYNARGSTPRVRAAATRQHFGSEVDMAKKALCIGINDYPGTQLDLAGCVNDANDWAAALKARGFTVQTMLDGQATKARMVSAISALVNGGQNGDSLVVTFSGHGTYAPDASGDEPDGLDEALCPHDIKQGQALIDDEIHQLFAGRKPGVNIVLISDSCHSGTVIRQAPPDPDAEGPRPRFMPMGAWLPEGQLPRGASGKPLTAVALASTLSPWAGAISSAGNDLLLAGCQEGPNNFSYDANFSGRPNGAFTYYALKTLKRLPATATYADWHGAIRGYLPSGNYPQTPQVMGSKAARKLKVLA
jgi:hypothetical protein